MSHLFSYTWWQRRAFQCEGGAAAFALESGENGRKPNTACMNAFEGAAYIEAYLSDRQQEAR